MKSFKDRIFMRLHDRGGYGLIEGVQCDECTFNNCFLSLTTDVNKRTTVRNVALRNCMLKGCISGPAIFEDVEVSGLETSDLQVFWSAMFKHVKLSGFIGKLKINRYVHAVDRSDATQAPFDESRKEYYKSVDWALDISDARFKGFDATGIPARLFRRDPESQAVVTWERVTAENGQRIARANNNPWLPWIRGALSSGSRDGVLVTPLGAPKKKRDEFLQGLRQLRELGIVEPE